MELSSFPKLRANKISKDSLAISSETELLFILFGNTKVKSKHNNGIASWLSSTKKFQASF